MRKTIYILIFWLGASYAVAETCEPSVDIQAKKILWGDLHVHSSFSMDAYVWNNQVTPAQAYAFAQGAIALSSSGESSSQRKLQRPLDFAAVTDHAEYFGVIQDCQVAGIDTAYCAELKSAVVEDSPRGFYELFLPALLRNDRLCQGTDADCRIAEEALWQRTIRAANEANQPCKFTALVANEWTASPDNLHWHRNIIYANDTVPERAINAFDEPKQTDMWAALEQRCAAVPGCDVLAIPHNSNLSMGGSFSIEGHSQAQLQQRAQFERLVEIHQHKGNSECFAGSVLSDEACEFENMLPIPLLRELTQSPRELTETERQSISSGYVRDTLAKGLAVELTDGINPFVYGFVGATDTHAGRPGDVQEQGWLGAIGSYDEDDERRQSFAHYNPGGLTAVWAQKNTRADVFSALKRRETYATSGPRIGLRIGMSANRSDCSKIDELVPMGGIYVGAQAPYLVVHAQQDQYALQQIDIVKLFVVDGQIQQRVHSWTDRSDGRADWCLTWQDSEYAIDVPSLWYVRVLEVPSKRWDGQTMVRERAWTSPIWSAAVLPIKSN